MTFQQVNELKSKRYPQGVEVINGIPMQVFIVPENELYHDRYLLGLSLNELNDDSATLFAPEDKFVLVALGKKNEEVIFQQLES